ncbi:MAG: DUF1905 domain-containing protein [Ardenticatenales bacterium]|nr:DUF1905 domain-containing protein [Ardenticatenales bacterium]
MSTITPQSFTASVTAAGSQTCIVLPFDPNVAWSPKGRHHVSGTIGGYAIRGELDRDTRADARDGDAGAYFLALGPTWRRDNGLDVGATVDVVLAPEGPIGDRLAPDLRAALDAAPEAKAFFEALPTFYRNNFARWIEDAKRPATRAARVVETVRLVGEGRRER